MLSGGTVQSHRDYSTSLVCSTLISNVEEVGVMRGTLSPLPGHMGCL